MEGKLHKQKDAEVRQLQKEVEKLLQERKVYLQALQEEKKRNCIQVRRRRILTSLQCRERDAVWTATKHQI